jgi:aryl-alcohol dehydrogenase-like predicted oxidoreductase
MGRRDDVILDTKFHSQWGDGINTRGSSRRWIFAAVENSLRRVRTDHIDLYQQHKPDPDVDLSETVGALDDPAVDPAGRPGPVTRPAGRWLRFCGREVKT